MSFWNLTGTLGMETEGVVKMSVPRRVAAPNTKQSALYDRSVSKTKASLKISKPGVRKVKQYIDGNSTALPAKPDVSVEFVDGARFDYTSDDWSADGDGWKLDVEHQCFDDFYHIVEVRQDSAGKIVATWTEETAARVPRDMSSWHDIENSTAFENFDMKTNQFFNQMSTIMLVFRESQEEVPRDIDYWMEKLDEYNNQTSDTDDAVDAYYGEDSVDVQLPGIGSGSTTYEDDWKVSGVDFSLDSRWTGDVRYRQTNSGLIEICMSDMVYDGGPLEIGLQKIFDLDPDDVDAFDTAAFPMCSGNGDHVSYIKVSSDYGVRGFMGNSNATLDNVHLIVIPNSRTTETFGFGAPGQDGAFSNWSSTVNYPEHAVVLRNRIPYQSLQDNNIGYAPETYSTKWRVCVFGATGQKYDTGWVSNSDWTNFSATITHNLDAPLPELIVKLFISSDGTDANCEEVQSAAVDFASTPASNHRAGAFFISINDNSFKLQTGAEGLWTHSAAGAYALLDTESEYYRVVAYKPGALWES